MLNFDRMGAGATGMSLDLGSKDGRVWPPLGGGRQAGGIILDNDVATDISSGDHRKPDFPAVQVEFPGGPV
jgi:hypothetical protein